MSESGAQLFARLDARRCLKDIEPRLFPGDGGPDHGEVVELFGTEGTGKSELLYHLLCRCVLPEAAGGLQVGVVFVDTDYSLDMLRLVSILDARLNSGTLWWSPRTSSSGPLPGTGPSGGLRSSPRGPLGGSFGSWGGSCAPEGGLTPLKGGSPSVCSSLRRHLLLSQPGRGGGAPLLFVPPPGGSLLLLLPAPPHPPLPGDLSVLAARPGAPPHRQHLGVPLAGPLRGRGQPGPAGGEAHQVCGAPAAPPQGLQDHCVRHLPQHQEESEWVLLLLRLLLLRLLLRQGPALPVSLLAAVGDSQAVVLPAGGSRGQQGAEETPGLHSPLHLLLLWD